MKTTLYGWARRVPIPGLRDRFELKYAAHRRRPILLELQKLPLAQTGVETVDGREVPFVELQDGTHLYGRWPTDFERKLHREWKDELPSAIREDTMRVSVDAFLRYRFPHAMPHLTLPYDRFERECFHPHHTETIEDLDGLSSADKAALKERYRIKPGEAFLDVGAYMGYPALRMSRELGSAGSVTCFEVDPDALWYLERNIARNGATNVTIVPKAAWNRDGATLALHQSGRSRNSVVSEVIDSPKTTPVASTTVDALLGDRRIDVITLTVNGAEVEALEGMAATLGRSPGIRMSIAGWYSRGESKICDLLAPRLRELGFAVAVSSKGRVLAWKAD